MKLFPWGKKKQKKNKIKQSVMYTQNENQLKIAGYFNKESYNCKELWLISRETKDSYMIAEISPAQKFEFNVDLGDLISLLPKNVTDTYDWYFKIRTLYEQISEKRKNNTQVKIIEENGETYAEYFIRCGRFHTTYREGTFLYSLNGQTLINYITTKGNFSLITNGEPNSPTKIQIDKFHKKQKSFLIKGKLFTRNSIINKAEVVLRGRASSIDIVTDTIKLEHQQHATKHKFGLNRYLYESEINTDSMNSGELLEEDVYDLFFKIELHDSLQPKYIRVGRPALRAKLTLKDIFQEGTDKAIVMNPYYTFKKQNLSFEVYEYQIDTVRYLRKLLRWAWLIRLINRNTNTWIVGERVYKAQDTGLAFFKYMRENYPNEKVYYVIEKNSPEKKNVEKYGNILEFKSKKHILYTLIAKKIISSHHPDYLYPIRSQKFKNKVRADKVFLQHGVMGTKNMVANYGKKAPGFDTDFFMVSSDFEKSMIVNDFGYRPDDVFVTGLSRFDTLFEDNVTLKRQILIIPTWRDWVSNDETFLESEYYKRYKSLINNQKLKNLSERYCFNIIFCLHPNMQRFSQYFECPGISVINQGEVDVQLLIKQSMLMLTDYSSVGFDFSFLHKPIIYYQFDRSRFIGNRPSHLDLNNDLPGNICFEEEEVLKDLEHYAANGFKMDVKFAKRADKFIKYKDRSSSERIFKVISSHEKNKSFLYNPKMRTLLHELFKKYRRSKYYFPSMRLFYKVCSKIIPVDKKLVLFESGLGKQLGDSPKVIYEELLHQNLNYKIVWVYNKNYNFTDKNTTKIKRLSPQYFYYLMRAGFWVNNQNFPHYIKKRSQTIYLQTWHGTPLKKMLHDLNEIHGRTEDYVDRVSNAVKNWDYLLSPSAYATKAFRSAFNYNGEVLEVGYPRNDIFYNEQRQVISEQVFNRLRLNKERKIILYAPTFRDDQTTGKSKFSFDINMDLNRMRKKLGDEYIILLRMHVVISNKLNIDEELKDFVINVSNYHDIQELLLITDVLITDYSSVMFDFANTDKPMIFFTYDLENYQNKLRGFYMNFKEEAPGPLVYNTDEIIENLSNLHQMNEQFKDKYAQFKEKYCYLEDGNSSKRVVEKLF